jgi:hypothetical protein
LRAGETRLDFFEHDDNEKRQAAVADLPRHLRLSQRYLLFGFWVARADAADAVDVGFALLERREAAIRALVVVLCTPCRRLGATAAGIQERQGGKRKNRERPHLGFLSGSPVNLVYDEPATLACRYLRSFT